MLKQIASRARAQLEQLFSDSGQFTVLGQGERGLAKSGWLDSQFRFERQQSIIA